MTFFNTWTPHPLPIYDESWAMWVMMNSANIVSTIRLFYDFANVAKLLMCEFVPLNAIYITAYQLPENFT